MQIGDALPEIFERAYPAVDPKTLVLPAISLLRFHEIDAVPLATGEGDGGDLKRAIFGFSSLARVMSLRPKQMGAFLERPCSTLAEPLATVTADKSVSSLLRLFAKTKFGFARVESRWNAGALADLNDALSLYQSGAIETDLTVTDVGSPVLSVPREAGLRETLETMYAKRYRRVFVSDTREFITDRGIIGYVFSPANLKSAVREARDVLGTSVSAIETITARRVKPGTTVKSAAKILRAERAGQCLVFDGMVATPWDLVMKPWIARALKVAPA